MNQKKENDNNIKRYVICISNSITKTNIGFTQTMNKIISIHEIRSSIENTFDDLQKKLLSKQYYFLYNTIPINSIQEKDMIPLNFIKPLEPSNIYVLNIIRFSDLNYINVNGLNDEVVLPDMNLVNYNNDKEKFEEYNSYNYEIDSPNEIFLELPPTVVTKNLGRGHISIGESDISSESDEKSVPKNKNICDNFRIRMVGLEEGYINLSLDKLLKLDISKIYLPFWIDVQGANISQINAIGKKFGLHPLTVEDISSPDTREKLEIFKKYLLVIFYSEDLILDEKAAEFPFSILLFSNFIISFHKQKESTIEHVIKTTNNIQNKSIRSPSWVCYAIIDKVIDDLIPITDYVLHEIENVEDIGHKFEAKDYNEFLSRVTKARRNILLLRQRLWPKQKMLLNMVQRTWRKFLKGVSIPYFTDCQDHVSKMLNSLELQNENLNNIQSMFLAKVSLEVAESSRKLDNIAKGFGSIATIILPLTFITGLLGMNITIPGQSMIPENDKNAICFWILMGIMVLFSLILGYSFWKKKLFHFL